ncbi:MAG: LamG domain-containing protein, partial [Bacteroidota bacterium]
AVVNTTECKYENCFTFAGVDSDNYISIPDSDLLDFTSGQFTLIAWIYPKSSGDGSNGRIFDKNGGVGNGWTLNMDSNNNFMMQINTNYKSSDTSVITYNQWNHVVATISSSGYIYFYVNGRDAGEGNIGVPPNAHTDPLRIGDRASDDGREFDGNIDEAMIFNRVLSAEEIQILYMSNLNKYAPDKWAFYINQSQNSTDGLVDGKYTYYASAKDGLGNENMTEERTLKIEAPLVNISLIYPTTNIDVSQNEFFNVTVNVSCVAGTCGTVNVSLDPEMIKNIIGVDEQVNVQVDGEVDEEGQIVENNFEGKSFFERVVGFITSKWDLMRGLFV